MSSPNVFFICSRCECSLERTKITKIVNNQFAPEISKLIMDVSGTSDYFRLIHSNGNGIPHALCSDCEDYQEILLCQMDAASFTCPHRGCKRHIIAG